MSVVTFNYADVKSIPVKQRKRVKSFVVELFAMEKVLLQKISFVFCSDDYLLNINRTFLNHDFFTDIITFDLSEDSEIIGEVYISIDRVKENAVTHNTSLERELLRVIFHGCLHLCGFKDKRKSEITIMRQKEDYYLSMFSKLSS